MSVASREFGMIADANDAAAKDAAALAYITCPDTDEAEKIGRALVERRLVACVNILPNMISIYRWNDAIARESEVVMIAKTRLSLADQMMAHIRELHSYDTPAIVIVRADKVEDNYLAWIYDETRG